jgi:hypothetical protein
MAEQQVKAAHHAAGGVYGQRTETRGARRRNARGEQWTERL